MDRMNTATKALTGLTVLALSVGLSACTNEAESMSMSEAYPGWDFSQSTPVRKTEGSMSGRFEVGVDGKLINPDADRTYEAPLPSDLANAPDKNGARAFAHYFVEVVEYTWRTDNTELLRSISHPDCAWCLKIADAADKRAELGGWGSGIRVAIVQTGDAIPAPDEPGQWDVVMELSQDPNTIYDGTSVHDVPLQETRFAVRVTHDGANWKVRDAIGEPLL